MIISLLVPILVVGCLISASVICFLLAAVFIRRYNRVKELKREGNIKGEVFDAREYGYEEDVTHKHREVLVNFFYDHPELTSSDFSIYETFINDVDRYNSTYLE